MHDRLNFKKLYIPHTKIFTCNLQMKLRLKRIVRIFVIHLLRNISYSLRNIRYSLNIRYRIMYTFNLENILTTENCHLKYNFSS